MTGRARPGPAAGDRVEVVFEVHRADGAQGRELAREQAAAIREVMEWIARKRSKAGQARAGETG